MRTLTVTAHVPMKTKWYNKDTFESCRIATKTFINMNFPHYDDVNVYMHTCYDEIDNYYPKVDSNPCDYEINSHVLHFIQSMMERNNNMLNKIKFDMSAILYIPQTWSFSSIGDYYDTVVSRIQYTFPMCDLGDIRFVYVPIIGGNIVTPIFRNISSENEKIVSEIIHATINGVFNEYSQNDTIRKHITSLEDIK